MQWQRDKNRADGEDKNERKKALRTLHESLMVVVGKYDSGYTCTSSCEVPSPKLASSSNANNLQTFGGKVMALLLDDMAKLLFRRFGDPAEGCRHVILGTAIRMVTLFVQHVTDLTPHLAYFFPVLMSRAVPASASFDPEMQLFIINKNEHEEYKRGKVTGQQDRSASIHMKVMESSEELRLMLCQLVGCLIQALTNRGSVGVLRPYFDDMIMYLQCQTMDPYPLLKEEALAIISSLAVDPTLEQASYFNMTKKIFTCGMKFYAVAIVRAIIPQIRHRHSKVRLAALEAVWKTVEVPDRAKVKGAGTAAIVDLVGFREDNVLPVAAFYGKGDTLVNHLAELTTDRIVAVREKTTAMLASWLTTLPDRYDHHTRLLPYLLNAVTDEAEVMSTRALEALSLCGHEYEREHQDEVIERRQFGVDGDIRVNYAKPLPKPFKSRPRIGARLYVRGNTRRFLQPLLSELCNWVSHTRLQSARLFRTLIVYCEEHLTVEMHKLIPQLQKALMLACNDKDAELHEVLLECCELLGRFVAPVSYLPHILPRIQGELAVTPFGIDANCRSSALAILSKMNEGTSSKEILQHIPVLINTITANSEDVAAEAASVRAAKIDVLLGICSCMKNKGQLATLEAQYVNTGRLVSLEDLIGTATRYLLICRSWVELRSSVDQCLVSLSQVCGFAAIHALVAHHAVNFMQGICEDYPIGPVWTCTCSPQLLLEGLLFTWKEVPMTCPEVLPAAISLCEEVIRRVTTFLVSSREEI
ncbi:unnamed protein product, partial [Discosporangium mesarthrocarpum]